MKCPFCAKDRILNEPTCAHCKFPFVTPSYPDTDTPDDMLQISGEREVLIKLYGKGPERRIVDFNKRMSWFRRTFKF